MATYSRLAVTLVTLLFTLPVVAQPDLEAFSMPLGMGFSTNPNAAVAGDTVVVGGWRVRNRGDSNAPVSSAAIYLSTDEAITSADRQLGSVAIVALNVGRVSGMQSLPVVIPVDVVPGDYYVGVIADADNSVAESDESNNALASNQIFTVLRPLNADLQLDPNSAYGPWIATGEPDNRKLPIRTALIAPRGELYVLYFELINSGPEAAPPFTVAYYLSADAALSANDRRLGQMRIDGIPGSDKIEVRNRNPIFLPEPVTPGSYTLIVAIDDRNEVIEHYSDPAIAETNNTFSFNLNVLAVPPDDLPVTRAQVRMTTGSISNAGSDESSYVAMNANNQTWLDYCRNDFEKGDSFTYDLTLSGVQTLRDLDSIRVGKIGDDGWCVQGVALYLNDSDSAAYEVVFPSCQWLDADSDDDEEWEELVSYDQLRSAATWNEDNVALPGLDELLTTRSEKIDSIVEATVGDAIHDNEAYWNRGQDGDCVRVERADDDSLSVDLDLKADVFGFDPRIDMDFDIDVGCDCDVITLGVTNLEVHVDSDWYAEILSFGIYELVDRAIKNGIEEQMGSQLAGLGQSMPTDLDFCPDISITSRPDIEVEILIQPLPDPTVTAGLAYPVISSGQTRDVQITVPNLGNVPVQFTTMIQFLFREGSESATILSSDGYDALSASTITLLDSDVPLTSVRCAPTQTTLSAAVQFPDDLQCTQGSRQPSRVAPPGLDRRYTDFAKYHLITRIRPDNDVNEQNNISVQLLNVRRPDLVAIPPEFSVSSISAGGNISNVSGRIENSGSAKSGPFQYRIYVQALGSNRRLNGPWMDAAGLAAGQSFSWELQDFPIPANVPSGQYAVGLEVETVPEAPECDLANNLAVQRTPLMVN